MASGGGGGGGGHDERVYAYYVVRMMPLKFCIGVFVFGVGFLGVMGHLERPPLWGR